MGKQPGQRKGRPADTYPGAHGSPSSPWSIHGKAGKWEASIPASRSAAFIFVFPGSFYLADPARRPTAFSQSSNNKDRAF